ncbi:MAG: YicC family protein [Deltaproteobacteria bacterium]|nr:MAG: YicC family protein [Deltaproteobacteria bacterium]
MIKSMTAYARSEIRTATYTICVEVRTYNNRHLDVALKLTHGYEPLEERIKAVIGDSVVRGRVEIRVRIEDDAEKEHAFEVKLPRAHAYHQALSQLTEALGIEAPIGVETILGAGGMIQAVDIPTDTDAVWPHVRDCLQKALAGLDAMRRVEGDNMARDFSQRLETIETMMGRIESEAAQLPDMYRQRLMERIGSLTNGIVDIDQSRIVQEAALLADRSDISEEVVRAKSHIQQFRMLMDDPAPAGRPLNFLLQEFNREFNTMGSKAGKASMSHVIVAVKSELEKLREQVQNVE